MQQKKRVKIRKQVNRKRGFMSNLYINCDDCELKATYINDMGNLVNLEHKVFSCKLCDFESEHGRELKTHNDNIFMT